MLLSYIASSRLLWVTQDLFQKKMKETGFSKEFALPSFWKRCNMLLEANVEVLSHKLISIVWESLSLKLSCTS